MDIKEYLLVDRCEDILFSDDDLTTVLKRRDEWIDYYREEQDSNHTTKDFPIYKRTTY